MTSEQWLIASAVAVVWSLGVFLLTLAFESDDLEDLWFPVMVWPITTATAVFVAVVVVALLPVTAPYFLARKIKNRKSNG